MLYITGGILKEYARDHRGCPDTTPPRDDISLEVPGELFFASQPDRINNMVATFIDTKSKNKKVKARAYLITLDQFEHILAQECQVENPVPVDLAKLRKQGILQVGDGTGLFNQLVYLGDKSGHPLVTFTNSGEHVVLGPPIPVYLEVLVRGLMQAHGLTKEQAQQYFSNAKGA